MQAIGSKAFFFEKKKQKIFIPGAADAAGAPSGRARGFVQVPVAKVFCFFFSKKKALLSSFRQTP